jgi:glutamate transport system permease protein
MTDKKFQKVADITHELSDDFSHALHPDEHIRQELSLGVEAEGLNPDNLQRNIPARKRGSDATLLFDNLGPSAMVKVRIFNVVCLGLFALLIGWALNMFAQNDQLNYDKWLHAVDANAWLHFYLPGLLETGIVSICAGGGAIVFGLFFGVLRALPSVWLRAPARVVIEVCRAVPVLLFMIFFWRLFALIGFGEDMKGYWAVFWALVLYNGSVIADLVRAGVYNLAKGQREAAYSLGMSAVKSLRIVELPQALRMMIPAVATQLIVVIKDTALGYIIVFMELLHEARRLGAGSDNMFQTLIVASVIYIVICYATSKVVERIG